MNNQTGGVFLMNEQTEKPFSVRDASKYLDVSVSHIYSLILNKKITFYKPSGKRIYFKKADLDKYLFRNEIRAKED